ncbi:MAG: hypothetical protein SFW67_16880 [Myxococcaceae bacterium]|nr:hypothetical protein [Myxococcaceae bacterium]
MRPALGLVVLALAGCGPTGPSVTPDAGRPAVDAGSLGPDLFCQVAMVGAIGDTLPCEATAVFARGGPNSTTLTVRTTAGAPKPELNFGFRVILEPEAGKTYGWADDVLSGDLSINDPARGSTFLASKAELIDPASFSFRPGETTGRVATSTGAQLRLLFSLEATLRPTPTSQAPNNTRVTISVTR